MITRLPASASAAAATPPPLPEPTTTTSASSVVSPQTDLQCLAGVLWRVLGRARVLHAGPQWVAAIRSGKAVGEQHRQLIQRGDRAACLGRDGCEVGEDLLADGLGLILELEESGAVDQLQQAGELLLG